MTLTDIRKGYLDDLNLSLESTGIELINQIQSSHISKYTFNSIAVVLSQEILLDSESVYQKIVKQARGGYCFEHNKLVFDVLTDLDFDVRILMARVVYNKDVDVPRTHRITLLTIDNEQYIVDAGFGHFCPRYPIKLDIGLEQDQGDACYRIEKNDQGEYCFQMVKEGEFFTLYTFDLSRYTEADCLTGHFYSHKYPQAGFVNNLVVCRKNYDDIRSLRNGEFHHIQNGETEITKVTDVGDLQEKLNQEFELDLDVAIVEFLYKKFVHE